MTVVDRPSSLLPERRPSLPAVARGKGLERYDRFTDTRPPRRWPIAVGIAIVMILALGALGATLINRASNHTIPDLRNQPERSLLDTAAQNGWRTTRVELRDVDVAAGNIIDTDPVAGKTLERGGLLTYTVSRGKPLVALPPDLVGKAAAEGRDLLTQAGFLVADPRTQFDETAPKGTILRVLDDADKPATTEAPKGSTLTLIVSNGPAQRAVPAGLENQQKDAVFNALKALRLNPQLKEDFSDTVPKDMVISLDPAVGTKLDVDAVVTVAVSKGPPPRKVPPTAGLTATQASAALEAAGFTVKTINGSATKTVLTTDPPAGEVQPFGTAITIIMRST